MPFLRRKPNCHLKSCKVTPTLSIFLGFMRRFFFTSILLIIFFHGNGQDWKDHYDQAIADYQSQRYPEAMLNAEKAFEASKTLDLKNQAFSLQLLTSICLEAQDYSKGARFSNDEIASFAQMEGKKSKHYAEALLKRAQMNQGLSNLKEAQRDYEEVSSIFSEDPGQTSLTYLKVQSSYGQVLIDLRDFNRAADVLNIAVAGLRHFPDEWEEYLFALYYSGYVEIQNKNVTNAEPKLKEFI